MLFNSLDFLFFVALVLTIHHGVLRSFVARKLFLLLASWFFYATWSPRFLIVLRIAGCEEVARHTARQVRRVLATRRVS